MGHCELPVLQWASRTSLESLCVGFCEGANGGASEQMRAGLGHADGAPVAHDCSSEAPSVTSLFLLQAPNMTFFNTYLCSQRLKRANTDTKQGHGTLGNAPE